MRKATFSGYGPGCGTQTSVGANIVYQIERLGVLDWQAGDSKYDESALSVINDMKATRLRSLNRALAILLDAQ